MDQSSVDHRNTWVTCDTHIKYDNLWIRVREDQIIKPDGNAGIYGVVHFKNIATGVVAIDEQGRIPLVGQWRYALGYYSWEIPEGGGHLDTPPLIAAQRELLEETGITATQWELLIESDVSNSVTDERSCIYLATDLTIGQSDPEGSEDLTIKWVSLDEAIQMVGQGEIRDMVSQLGILTAANSLSE